LTVEALNANAKTYVANYTKRFGTPPSPSSPYAYDQVYVLKQAVERAGSAEDPKKVMAEVRKVTVPAEAVMKYLRWRTMFDVNGRPTRPTAPSSGRRGSGSTCRPAVRSCRVLGVLARLAQVIGPRQCRWTAHADHHDHRDLQQMLNGLAIGSVYTVIALGLTVVFGILGIAHFATARSRCRAATSPSCSRTSWPSVLPRHGAGHAAGRRDRLVIERGLPPGAPMRRTSTPSSSPSADHDDRGHQPAWPSGRQVRDPDALSGAVFNIGGWRSPNCACW